jgi:hypothetical protein
MCSEALEQPEITFPYAAIESYQNKIASRITYIRTKPSVTSFQEGMLLAGYICPSARALRDFDLMLGFPYQKL